MSIQRCKTCGGVLGDTGEGDVCPACALRGIVSVDPLEDETEEKSPSSLPTLPRVFGPYELIEELGRGGMGVVYRARQLSLGRTVAIKLLLAGAHSSETTLQRFRTEASAAAGLRHPNIVAIHDYGEVEGQPYYTMDRIEGQNLSDHCGGKPLDARQAAEWMRFLASAVQHAHERGVLHRDLKPSNIIVDRSGRPYVTDFGLAKLYSENGFETLSGQAMGSPGYLAPEQARAESDTISAATDVYGLGALFFHLLTGRAPFNAATTAETFRMVLEESPPSPRVLNPSVPRDLEVICLKCLETEPARRYETAAELAEDLDRFLTGRPIRARAPGKLYLALKYGRRHWVGVSAVAAIVVLAVGGMGAAVFSFKRAVKLHEAAIAAHKDSRSFVDGMIEDLENRTRYWDPRPWVESADEALTKFNALPQEFRDLETKRNLARALNLLTRDQLASLPTIPQPHIQFFTAARDLWEEVARTDANDSQAAAASLFYSFRVEADQIRNAKLELRNEMYARYDGRALELERRFPESIDAKLAVLDVRCEWMARLAEWGELERAMRIVEDAERRRRELLDQYPLDIWNLTGQTKTLQCLSYCYRIAGDTQRFREARVEMVGIIQSLSEQDLSNTVLMGRVAQAVGSLTNNVTPGELDATIREATHHIRRMREFYPEETYWTLWDASMYLKSGFSLASDRRDVEAMSQYESALAIVESVQHRNYNRHPKWVWGLGDMGAVASRLGNDDVAWENLARLRADRPVWMSEANFETERTLRRVISLIAEHRILESLELWEELETVGRTLAEIVLKIELGELQYGYPVSHLAVVAGAILGQALLEQGKFQEALPWLERVDARLEDGVHVGAPTFAYTPSELWDAGEFLAEALVLNEEPERAAEVLDRVLREWEEHVAVGGKLLSRIAAARCSWRLAQLVDPGVPEQAIRRRELLDRAAELLDAPDTEPRLLPEEREMREDIEVARRELGEAGARFTNVGLDAE